ncbi:kynurenine/alpha-aminoadipate aminotransferase [Paraphysoderma sedebokerense]|nr:kynurenine/alpha-aminoadipate aminotransferase [Paraphysoderma sedebokerense]
MTTPPQKPNYSSFIAPLSASRKPSAIRAIQPLMKIPGMISLAGGLPNPDTFPVEGVTIKLKSGKTVELTKEEVGEMLQYGPTSGHPILHNFLTQLTQQTHTPPSPFQLHIGNGSQDLISKTIYAILSPGDTVIIEKPCYSGTLAILRPMGLNVLEVETDKDGIIPSALKRLLEKESRKAGRIKCLYTVPTGSNPSGSMTGVERKKQVYEICRDFDLLLLEDDPYYFLQFLENGKGFEKSYLSLDVDGRVVRFESLSKIVSAGFRLGFMTGPPEIVERVVLDSQATSLQPTGPSQTIMNTLINHEWKTVDGFYKHVETVANFYKERRDFFVQCLEQELNGLVEYDIPKAGMFIWIRLPTIPNTHQLITTSAVASKILLLPGIEFYVDNDSKRDCQFVRVTYSVASKENMREACKRLRRCIEEAGNMGGNS